MKGEVSDVSAGPSDECEDVIEPVFDVVVGLPVSPVAAETAVVASGVKLEAPEFVGDISVPEANVLLEEFG